MPQVRSTAEEIRYLVELPRPQFEGLVAELYRALGHEAACTGAKDENAVHIVVQAKNGEKWIVQCRQWRGAVGEFVVRDFYAQMQQAGAAQGAIITTAKFTPKAREWVKGKSIYLYDGDGFVQAMKRIQSRAGQQPQVVRSIVKKMAA
jgi:restriction system protein